MAPKKALAATPAQDSKLHLASKSDAKASEICLFCGDGVHSETGPYVIMMCSPCGDYALHKECLEAYLQSGLGDYKVSSNTQKKGVREARIRKHPALEAKGRRCGRGLYGTSVHVFPRCSGTVNDTELSDKKDKRESVANVPAHSPIQTKQKVEQPAKQVRPQAKGAAGPSSGVLNKVGLHLRGKDETASGGTMFSDFHCTACVAGLVSSTAGGGLGGDYGGETLNHAFKMTGIEAELAVHQGLIKDKSFRTKLCPLERTPGACPNGDVCNDAHSVEELRIDEAIKRRNLPMDYKCKFCASFAASGQCINGLYCTDAHSVIERRIIAAIQHRLERQDYKTRYCSTFGTQQPCARGLLCRDAHTVEEHRRDAAWVGGMVTKALDSDYKTVLCAEFFKKGMCKNGCKCDFAHGPKDLRVTAALQARQLYKDYKIRPCRKGMACLGPAGCWNYHSEQDRMSPHFIGKRRLCPTWMELGWCRLNGCGNGACPFAHHVLELSIADSLGRKVKRWNAAKAAAAGGTNAQALPGHGTVPQSILEGKLPAKEPLVLSKSALKRLNKVKNKALMPVDEEDDGAGEGAAGLAFEAALPGEGESEALRQSGFTEGGRASHEAAAAQSGAEIFADVSEEIKDAMRTHKLNSCYHRLSDDFGYEHDKAWAASIYCGADVEDAIGVLLDLEANGDARLYDLQTPISVDIEVEELYLLASQLGLTQEDVVAALQSQNGNYDAAKEVLNAQAQELAPGNWQQDYDDHEPAALNFQDPAQAAPGSPRASSRPSSAPLASAAPRSSARPTSAPIVSATPSVEDRLDDRDYAQPTSAYIYPLPFPAAHPPTAHRLVPCPEVPQHALEPTPAPAVTAATVFNALPQDAWPAEGQTAILENQLPQDAVSSRPGWPEHAFLGFSPNRQDLPLAVGAPPPVLSPPNQPISVPAPIAAPPEAAESDGDDSGDDEARLQEMLANLF